jgi:hypothetical protein
MQTQGLRLAILGINSSRIKATDTSELLNRRHSTDSNTNAKSEVYAYRSSQKSKKRTVLQRPVQGTVTARINTFLIDSSDDTDGDADDEYDNYNYNRSNDYDTTHHNQSGSTTRSHASSGDTCF